MRRMNEAETQDILDGLAADGTHEDGWVYPNPEEFADNVSERLANAAGELIHPNPPAHPNPRDSHGNPSPANPGDIDEATRQLHRMFVPGQVVPGSGGWISVSLRTGSHELDMTGVMEQRAVVELVNVSGPAVEGKAWCRESDAIRALREVDEGKQVSVDTLRDERGGDHQVRRLRLEVENLQVERLKDEAESRRRVEDAEGKAIAETSKARRMRLRLIGKARELRDLARKCGKDEELNEIVKRIIDEDMTEEIE
jgi:hypothetical protein